MTLYGRIEEILPAQGDWSAYAERLSYYFKTYSITNANRKKAVLLSMCGTETLSLLKDLITPNSLRDKMFDELTQALEEPCNPVPSARVERFNFYMRRQQLSQTIQDFIAHFF